MIKNIMIRVWVNRVFAFLAGGLLIFIIMQTTIVSFTQDQNIKLTKEIDEIKYAPGRLLEEGRAYFEKNDYDNAQKILTTLFEKHPVSEETKLGRMLYAKIENMQIEMDKKWNAALPGIREEWTKKMTVQLKEQFEKDIKNNLDREWENTKRQIKEEWKSQI
jgi:hypothetical protein